MAIKQYFAKVYDPTGAYLKTWSDIIDRGDGGIYYSQEINNPGSQLIIDLGRAADNFGEGTDVAFNNKVEVWVRDKETPNGSILFVGFIADYIPYYEPDQEYVEVVLLGYGSELSNFMVETGESLDQFQASYNSEFTFSSTVGNNFYIGQIFQPGSTGSLSRIEVKLAWNNLNYASSSAYMLFYSGIPDGTNNLIETVGPINITTPTTGASPDTIYSFAFSSPISVTGGSNYFFVLDSGGAAGGGPRALQAGYNSAGGYANGQMFSANAAFNVTRLTGDLVFNTYLSSASTTVTYNSQDPSAILKSILDDYKNKGGTIGYTNATIDTTGSSVSYTFNTNTMLEGVNKCLELAPSGWYWYIDQSTNLLHFHQKAGAAEQTYTLGRDIISLIPEKRTESVVNVIYFTGGDVGSGVNLFKKYVNTTSAAIYGRKQQVYTDNRVTLTATADTIANTILNNYAAPEIRTTIDIVDSNVGSGNLTQGYDIESIKLGKMVNFGGIGQKTGSLWDVAVWDVDVWDFNIYQLESLVLQITRLSYWADKVELVLSTIPPDISKRIEDINRRLEAQQTINNPSAPS